MATAINKKLNGTAMLLIQQQYNSLLKTIRPFSWFSVVVKTASPIVADGIFGIKTADAFANLFGGKIPTVEAWETYYKTATTKLNADNANATAQIKDTATKAIADGKSVEAQGISFMDVVKVALMPLVGPMVFTLHPSLTSKPKPTKSTAANETIIDDSTASVPIPHGAASSTVNDNNGLMLMAGVGLLAFGLITKFSGNGGKK